MQILRLALLSLTLCLPNLAMAQGSAELSAEQLGPPPVPRVLLVGDSWSDFMWIARSMRDTFEDNGRPDIVEDGTSTTLSGSTADEWTSPSMLQLITDALDATPSIDIVQLTLGGNDFLAGEQDGGWFTTITPVALEALHTTISDDVATVVDHVLAYDPGMHVVLSLYDYANFPDSSSILGCGSRWERLGEPTPRQINDASIAFQDVINQLVAARPRVSIVDHAGSMQELFGFPSEGIQPGDLQPPGDLDRPSPIEAMFLGLDCIHLSATGYRQIGQNLWDGFYALYLANQEGAIFANGFESGDSINWDGLMP